MKRTLFILLATIAFIASVGIYTAFASSSHTSHTPLRNVPVTASQAFKPVAWSGNTERINVPATWSLSYSCDGGYLAYYVVDTTGKATKQVDGVISHNPHAVCDNSWHVETFHMSAATTILIAASRANGVSINVTA